MTLRERFILIVAGIAIIFAIYGWFKKPPTPPVPPKPISGELKPVPSSKPTGTVKCPDSGIIVVSGPQWLKDIKDEEKTIASGVVEPWGGKTNVWTYMNLQTGSSRMVFEQQPFEVKPNKESFFEWVNIKEIGVFYGYGTDGRAIQLYGQWDLIRTGAINWKSKIEVDIYNDKTNSFLYIGGGYRWK